MANTEMAVVQPGEIVGVDNQIQPQTRPADQQPARVYVMRHAKGSGRSTVFALDMMANLLTGGRCGADTLPWGLLRYQHTAAIRAALQDRYAPASVNKFLSHLRGVLREAWQLGQMPTDDYQRAIAVRNIVNETLPSGRALSQGELRALFEVCVNDEGVTGRRDAAMLAVLYGAGLRRSELVNLDLADYESETGALVIRQGKGNKDRVAYATNGSKVALDEWLQVRGVEPGPLFLPLRKGGEILHKRLTDQTVFDALNRRAREAGVARVSPHDFRRTFISDLLDAGADIATVQKLAGHANIATTARYDRRGEKVKRKTAELLHVPMPGRKEKICSDGQKKPAPLPAMR